MELYSLLSDSFRYPKPDLLQSLSERLEQAGNGTACQKLRSFLDHIRPLNLGEWEELYTLTWDLDPAAAPYIGFHIYGETYGRGTFMAQVNAALLQTGIDCAGELPDHLVPVLAYLAVAQQPVEELVSVLPKALEMIRTALQKADPDNPYLDTLEAALLICQAEPYSRTEPA